MPELSPRAADRARSPWPARIAIGCVLAVVAAAAYLFLGAGNSSAATSGLRTATVARGDVDQTTTLTGTVRRVGQVTAAFPASGHVTAVRVAVGDTVRPGQVLATMDTADLAQSMTVAEANLVAAQAALNDAETTASTTSTTATSTPSPSATAPATSKASTGSGSSRSTRSAGSGTGGSGSKGRSSGGSTVDTGRLSSQTRRTQSLLAAVTTACAPLATVGAPPHGGRTPTPPTSPASTTSTRPTPTTTTAPTPSTSLSSTQPTTTSSTSLPVTTTSPATTSTSTSATTTGTTSSTISASPTSSPTTPPTTAPTAAQIQTCVAALGAALAAEQDTGKLAAQLATALDRAATALQTQAATATTTTSGRSTGSGSGSTGATTGSGTGTGSGRNTPTAGSEAALEVSVLKAQQALATAQQDLAGATLTAPVAGTVGAISVVAGQTASTSEGITIVAPGTAVLSASVPLAQLGRLRIGQAAQVLPAGTTTALGGAIQTIGVLPASTSSTTPTYPVEVAVSDAPTALATGSQASASVTLASVVGVLTVPVSALTGVTQGYGSVTVLKGSTSTATRVRVGAIGQGLAQVLSGLSLGQLVVLADASQPLPTANPLTARLGGGGGFGGGGAGFTRSTTGGGTGAGAGTGGAGGTTGRG